MNATGNLITGTLSRAFSGMWDLFWPVLGPVLVLLAIAFAAYVWRKFTNLG
jgi:hypothetical protein